MGVGETGQIIGETGVGETGVGEMGVNRCIEPNENLYSNPYQILSSIYIYIKIYGSERLFEVSTSKGMFLPVNRKYQFPMFMQGSH